MADEDKVEVIITFDPENPKRNETKESLPAAEAYSLVNTGRARLASDEKATKKSGETKKTDTL